MTRPERAPDRASHKAAPGGRTKKTGQSRWFIGYKKHTLRLWLAHYSESVLLVPLMTWAAPANRGEALFLWPSLRHCAQRLQWLPNYIARGPRRPDRST